MRQCSGISDRSLAYIASAYEQTSSPLPLSLLDISGCNVTDRG
jgi:hypothetical protein